MTSSPTPAVLPDARAREVLARVLSENGHPLSASSLRRGDEVPIMRHAIRAMLEFATPPASDPAVPAGEGLRNATTTEVVDGGVWSLRFTFGRGDEARDRMRATAAALANTPDRFDEGYRAGREAAAKAADACADHEGPFTDYFRGRDQGCHDAAAAIRALRTATGEKA